MDHFELARAAVCSLRIHLGGHEEARLEPINQRACIGMDATTKVWSDRFHLQPAESIESDRWISISRWRSSAAAMGSVHEAKIVMLTIV